MGDARVTQSPTLATYEGDADARVTQATALSLYEISPDARVTQATALSLYYVVPDARVTQAAVLVLCTDPPCVMRRAQCWKITRLDGQVFAYTTHDEPITYLGTTYIPCDSLRASASSAGISTGNDAGDIEMTGIVADDAISDEDIAAGKFDGATVEVVLVPWDTTADPGIPRRISKGVVARIEHSPTKYNATVLTPGSKLTQSPILTTYTPACRWNLGSTECGVDLSSNFLETGSVTDTFARDAVNQISYRKFTDVLRAEAAGYFDFGKLTWTSGANNGLSAEVKYFDGSTFELWDVMPNEIALTDTYEVTPGCRKSTTDCSTKFSNLINFGGFPNVPGKDSIYETPDAK